MRTFWTGLLIFWINFLSACSCDVLPYEPRCKQTMKWCCPSFGAYKVNTNAAIFSTQRRIGFGIIVRDHAGDAMGSSSQSLIACLSAQIAEAMAVLCGIIFTVETGLLPTVIESDSKSVVDLINSGKAPIANVGIVIRNVFELMNCYPVLVSFTGRSANCVAHGLAKLSISLPEDRFWLETCPARVEDLVMADRPV
ncbi:hypothetical protein Ddye_023880 [Dipteronia dyeriana]|uniref:RNase H type-1 domain-containing protein n=1 Tax=Dipteronia dyeriana TaxID=168575 RepID=A0AAD9TU95_9ROSI|nr:hypothetical protein Ddye_023880 [Dipteronia dyeriana]